MLRGFDWLKANEGNVHGHQLAQTVEGRVRHVQLVLVAAHEQQAKHVQRNQVNDVHVPNRTINERN